MADTPEQPKKTFDGLSVEEQEAVLLRAAKSANKQQKDFEASVVSGEEQ